MSPRHGVVGQFEAYDWVELLVAGSARAPARKPCLSIPSKKTRSGFALNAGEGARVPSTKSSLKLKLTHFLVETYLEAS